MARNRRRSTTWALSAVAALLLGACGHRAPEPSWRISTDTTHGVLRVLDTPPEAGPSPTLIAKEELRVGTAEGGGPASFGMVREIAVLRDGRFAVADGQAEEVRLFDPDGHYLRTFGGEGAGPGELRGIQGVYVGPDGMLRVPEQGNARLSVFHPDSGFVTTYPLQLHRLGSRGPWAAAVDSAGRTLVVSAGLYRNGFWRMVRVYDPEMNQLDSIPFHDYAPEARRNDLPGGWQVELGDGSRTWVPVPFYARPYEVLAPTGEFWSSAEGQAELEVARWTPPGDTSLVLVSRRPPDPVTRAERDSAMAALRQQLAEQAAKPPRLDASRVPATRPPLYGLSLDDAGRLWVRVTEPAADSTVYDVFGRDGHHSETVSLPFRVDTYVPPVVRGRTLWAVVTDDMDVQYVVRAALRKNCGRNCGRCTSRQF